MNLKALAAKKVGLNTRKNRQRTLNVQTQEIRTGATTVKVLNIKRVFFWEKDGYKGAAVGPLQKRGRLRGVRKKGGGVTTCQKTGLQLWEERHEINGGNRWTGILSVEILWTKFQGKKEI